MRDIKFRMWDEQYEYMNYKVMIGMWGSEEIMDDENYTACMAYVLPENVDYKCEPHWCHFEPYNKHIKIMQYIGLKDKNGKDIYEGDILDYGIYGKFEVLYHKGSFKIRKLKFENGNVHLLEDCSFDDIKVIGNIYENSELLG